MGAVIGDSGGGSVVTIRAMAVEDIPAAVRLWQGAPGVNLRGADSPPALTRYLARNPGCSFVALAGAEVVGVSLAGHDGRRGYLHHVVVSPAHRRLGVGRRLVEACLAALAAEGIGKVLLFVKADNEAGRAFWNRLGWRERPDVALMSLVLGDDPNACPGATPMNGLLVIDKPGGVTSRGVVNRVQRWFPRGTKLGHTGTLDPLATGVLVLCVGAATRLADLVQGMGKSYRSRFRLGARSDTDDADGTVTPVPGAEPPSEEAVRAALASFVGEIRQVPPAYSALKFDGRRAHDLARRGKAVSLAARTVRVDAVRLLGYGWPFADVEIDCGKGTYVRSIARDLGEKLGCGGLVETLRRTRVGPFTAGQGVGLDVTPEEGRAKLRPMADATVGMLRDELGEDDARRFRQGQLIQCSPRPGAPMPDPRLVAVFGPDRKTLIGIAEQGPFFRLRPVIVLG